MISIGSRKIPPNPVRTLVVQPGPLDAMIDPASGNLLLAMGHAGVLLRLTRR